MSTMAEETSQTITENATAIAEESGITGGFAGEGEAIAKTDAVAAEAAIAEENQNPYTYTLEIPDSDNVPMLKQSLGQFTELCKNNRLSREQANAVLEWQKGRLKEAENESLKYAQNAIKDWESELRNDPEFGGMRYTRTLADARNALNAFDPDGDLRQLLIDTHGQFEPSVVRFAARIGRAIAEHKFIQSDAGPTDLELPLQDRIWGKDGTSGIHQN